MAQNQVLFGAAESIGKLLLQSNVFNLKYNKIRNVICCDFLQRSGVQQSERPAPLVIIRAQLRAFPETPRTSQGYGTDGFKENGGDPLLVNSHAVDER